MGSLSERREHAWFTVGWAVTYWNEELFAQGTLLNLSTPGCHLVGTMPVAAGMVLKMWVFPANREQELCVQEARVLWAKEHQFGVELRHLPTNDQQWLSEFLENAERRRILRSPVCH